MSFIFPALERLHEEMPPSVGEPPSRASLLLATEIPLTVLTTLVVFLRIVSRARLTVARVEIDDWLMLSATICSIGLFATDVVAVRYGWGVHIWDTKLEDLQRSQQTVLANEILFTLTVGMTKLSILMFYKRVFSAYGTFRKFALAGIAYCSSWMVAVFFTAIFQCSPVKAFWVVDIKGYKCVDMYAAIMATSVLNSVSDIYVFAIPIRYVWKLTLPVKQRIGLIIAFGLGFIACIVGMIRIKYLKLATHDSGDVTWHGSLAFILNTIEADLGIICASMPALRPLFVRLFPSFRQDKPRNAPSRVSNGVKEISRVWRRFHMNAIDSGVADMTVTEATVDGSRARGDDSDDPTGFELRGKSSNDVFRFEEEETQGEVGKQVV